MINYKLTAAVTVTGVVSYEALGHVPPRLPTISFALHFTAAQSDINFVWLPLQTYL